jgi:2-phospho-L-lactate/phosphoenolpyruvate guanylyltransferase
MRNAVLIPVKEFHEAKKRLAPHFSSTERAALAEAMCKDFFSVVTKVRGVGRVFVISKETRALAWARALGWETIPESRQVSESDSVDAASSYCAERGIESLLRLPIDIPIAQAADIEAIFRESRSAPGAVIVPSGDGTGTNALLRTPPTLFPSHFGPNSFKLHLAEAERCGVRARVLRNLQLELDVDEMDDLRRAAPHLRPGSATAQWFERHGIVPSEAASAGARDRVLAAGAGAPSATAKGPKSAAR